MTPEQKRVALVAHLNTRLSEDYLYPGQPALLSPVQIGSMVVDMFLQAQALDQASEAPALDTTPPDEAKAEQTSFSDAWEKWRTTHYTSYASHPAVAKHFFEAGQRTERRIVDNPPDDEG